MQPTVYALKITPHRAPAVSRTIEMLETSTLFDLHCCIQVDFDLDDDHLYAFFLTNKAWDRKGVYVSPRSLNEKWERDATKARLSGLRLRAGRKFLYLFDFGDELHHEVTVVAVKPSEPGVKYPRVIEAIGSPPRQYRQPNVDDDLEEMVKEVAAASSERLDSGEAPAARATTGRDSALMKRTGRALPRVLERSGLRAVAK